MPYKYEKRAEIFFEKAKKVHPRGNLDFSKFVFVDSRTKGLIIDHDLRPDGTEYGEYWQIPSNVLKGQEHPDKRADKISKTRRMSIDEILRKCHEAHPNENLEYFPDDNIKNLHSMIRIVDHDLDPNGNEYGEYIQEINSHIRGHGHPQKAIDKNTEKQRRTLDEFIEIAKKVHANHDYDYSLTEYVSNNDKVTIFCNKIGTNGKPHGAFRMTPSNFLKGKGCPRCGYRISKAEDQIVKFLTDKGFVCEQGKRGIIKTELDIYLPSEKFAIEFDGLRWHTEQFGKTRNYHLQKTVDCEKQGVKLIHIFEDEWVKNKELVLNKIATLLNVNKNRIRVGGRQCIIKTINREESNLFLKNWHIQGGTRSTIYYGAYYNNVLIGVMSFKYYNKNDEWELTRFATHGEYLTPGLASKMFKHFVKDANPGQVKSFADRRWTVDKNNNLYIKLGFTLSEIEPPNYSYVTDRGFKRQHKFGFKKQILIKKYNLPEKWTEKQMCEHLGFYRMWDCGLFKYTWGKT